MFAERALLWWMRKLHLPEGEDRGAYDTIGMIKPRHANGQASATTRIFRELQMWAFMLHWVNHRYRSQVQCVTDGNPTFSVIHQFDPLACC